MSRFDRLISAVGGCLLIALMSSCRTVGVEDHAPVDTSVPVDQSIVILIHGDGDYLYHDTDGTAFQADEEAVDEALRIAERNPTAEVFIFHERPRKRRLFLFPRDDGTFYYFRAGELLVEETYRRGKGDARLNPEVAYYHRYGSASEPGIRMLVYMGHEIPEMGNVRYDGSRRHGAFSLSHFSRGMAELTRDNGPFDLMVLSTCYGGTPHTIRAMAPFAQNIIASPDNLHLSHLDLAALERLDEKLEPGDGHPGETVPDLALQFARESFDRLAEDLQTVVTVAVYDVDRVLEYVNQVAPAYDSTLASLQGLAPARLEHVDCAEIEGFIRPGMSEGVDVFYRPPQFGRRADRSSHSGWQCWQDVNRR